ncbi:MAG TPA: carboxypeptidase-like regulatory domain-containing protein, partial [Candidatus Polarisedimenticolaceae bacterium]|nr:carboxypeptidase-like regulatory domain-containing protein [Candidatus Polarisedimenticolaceae bacterium]
MMRRRSWWIAIVAGMMLAANAAHADEIEIAGRVLLPAGKPLPEAEVTLRPLLDELARAAAVSEAEPAKPAAQVRTDAQGRFTLLAPHAGLWAVRVEAPGFVPIETELRPLVEPRNLPDAELTPDAGFTVKVTAGGQPVSGALVRVDGDRSGPFRTGDVWPLAARFGRTGADGSLRL